MESDSGSSGPSSPPNFLCKVCLRSFSSERGLLLHRTTISSYNRPKEHVDMLPSQTVEEFQRIFVFFIHKKLKKNPIKYRRQKVTLPCTKSQFFSIFRGYIHSTRGSIYKCFFKGSWGKKQLDSIFNGKEWSEKHHGKDKGEEKNYKTIVLLEPPSNQEDINKKCYRMGEVVIEWKEKMEREINNKICYAGLATMNFYVAQVEADKDDNDKENINDNKYVNVICK
jgi:hypothetical protein